MYTWNFHEARGNTANTALRQPGFILQEGNKDFSADAVQQGGEGRET